MISLAQIFSHHLRPQRPLLIMPTDDDFRTAISSSDASPITEILKNLGMTREELMQHASQMRHFFDGENGAHARLAVDKTSVPLGQHAGPSSSSTAPDSTRESRPLKSLPRASRSHEVVTTPSPPPPPCSSHAFQPTQRPPTVHTSDDSDDSNDTPASTSATMKQRGDCGEGDERRGGARGLGVSPARPKPSLDEIMQMHSRQSRRVSESEESDDSSDESLRVSDALFGS